MQKKLVVLVCLLLMLAVIFAANEPIRVSVIIPGLTQPTSPDPVIPQGVGPTCGFTGDNDRPGDCGGCESGYVLSSSGRCEKSQTNDSSIVSLIRQFNAFVISGAAGFESPTAGKVITAETKPVGEKSSATLAKDIGKETVTGVVRVSNNIKIEPNYSGENSEYAGKKVFYAELPAPYLEQEFWIDLSDLQETLPVADLETLKPQHRKYNFKLEALSLEENKDYFRFMVFDVTSKAGAKFTEITADYEGTVDCALSLRPANISKTLESAWTTIQRQSVASTAKEVFFSLFAGKVSGAAGGVAYTGASRVSKTFIGKVATLVPGLRTGTKFVLKGANVIGFTGYILSSASRMATVPTYNDNLKWYDAEKYFPTLFSKKLHLDLLNSSKTPCQEETINNYEFRGEDFDFIFVSGKLPDAEGKPITVYFTIEPAKVVGFNTFTNTSEYKEIPTYLE
jgi:hypothetical protein